ncbi:MAG TPA: hypothetical protein VL993_11035 [Stellaceae bacterium]|nr:hypothetical protein [Stellaceae bacterium]
MEHTATTSHLIAADAGPHRLVARSRMNFLFALWAMAMRCFWQR